MFSSLPLDDEIGRTILIDGATWRVVFDRDLRRFALKPVALDFAFAEVVERVASGAMLWQPAARFEPLDGDSPVDAVQKEVSLLDAFRRSPACVEAHDWQMVARVDARLADCRTWLARRARAAGESPDGAGE